MISHSKYKEFRIGDTVKFTNEWVEDVTGTLLFITGPETDEDNNKTYYVLWIYYPHSEDLEIVHLYAQERYTTDRIKLVEPVNDGINDMKFLRKFTEKIINELIDNISQITSKQSLNNLPSYTKIRNKIYEISKIIDLFDSLYFPDMENIEEFVASESYDCYKIDITDEYARYLTSINYILMTYIDMDAAETFDILSISERTQLLCWLLYNLHFIKKIYNF